MSRPADPAPRPPAGDVVYRERRFELRRCTLHLTDGRTSARGLVIHPGSVVLLPILDDGRVVFIRNHRWQLGHPLLELPAGTLDPAEEPLACAARELVEETGYRADQLEPWTPFYAAPGLSTELMFPFVARRLTHVGQRLEPDERIDVLPLTLDAARDALTSGALHDAKTLAVLGRFLLTLG